MLPKNLRTLWVETSPEKAIARARKLLDKGKLDGAISVLKDTLEAGGEEQRVRMELSQILLTSGRAKEAADGYKHLLKASPESHHQVAEAAEWARANQQDASPLHEVLAEHLVSRKDLQGGFAALERMGRDRLKPVLDARLNQLGRFLGADGRSIPRTALPVVFLIGLLQEAMGDDPAAVQTYAKIAKTFPGDIETVDSRLKGIVVRHYRSAPLRAMLAELYLTAGQELRAIEEYVQMAELDARSAPQAAAALEELASVSTSPQEVYWGLVRIRHKEGAREELLRAAGSLLAANGHLEELYSLLEALSAEGKPDPRLKLLTGEAALKVGKGSRAIGAFSSVASEGPPEVRSLARDALGRMLATAPENPDLISAVVDLDIRANDIDSAVGHIKTLSGISGSEAAAVARLQSVLISHPDHGEAEALLEQLSISQENPTTSAVFLRRRLRRGKKEAAAALKSLKGLVDRYPDNSEAKMALAEALMATGDPDGSWRVVKPFLDASMGPDPQLLHLMVLIGGSSKKMCQKVTAAFCDAAPALAGSPEGQFALGEMAARCGDLKAAVESFKPAAAFSPAAAAETIQALRTLCPPEKSGEAATALADLLADMGDFSAAAAALASPEATGRVPASLLDKLQNAFRADPENVELRVAVASALAAGGNAAHARRLIEDGIRRAGADAPASLHLAAGDAWVRESNLTEAVRSYARAMARDKSMAEETARRLAKVLEKDVGHASAHLAMGRARLLGGSAREGVNELLTAWSIKPELGETILKDLAYAAHAFPLEPQVALARSQVQLAQGEVDAAAESMGMALQTSPSVAGDVLVRLQSLVRDHPSCAKGHFHAAQAWLVTGRCAEASKALVAAAEQEPALLEKSVVAIGALISKYPGEPAPHVAHARLEELRGNRSASAEAYCESLEYGADPSSVLDAMRRLAGEEGQSQGRTLVVFARALRQQSRAEQAASSLDRALALAPELIHEIEAEASALCRAFAEDPAVLLMRAKLSLASLDTAGALRDAERLLDMDPSRWGPVSEIVFKIAEAGGDAAACALLRARAFAAGGEYVAAADLLDEWISRCEGERRIAMCLTRARVERRRGDVDAARKWTAEAERLSADREGFLSNLHEETVQAARSIAMRQSTTSDLWKGLWASLQMGDADGAEKIAASLGLNPRGGDGVAEADREAAREALALIACMRGNYGAAAELMVSASSSRRKAHIMERAGRLAEAAACLEDLAASGAEAGESVRRIYGKLAATELLGEPACLEAETQLDFSARTAIGS